MAVAVRASPLVFLPSSPFAAFRNLKKQCNTIIILNIGLHCSHSKSRSITISSIKCSASTSAIISKEEEPLPLEVNEIKTMCKTWVWRCYNINCLSYQARNNNTSRPSLLLVHGLGASVAHWCRNIATLAQNYTVYAIDLLGFGASDKPEGFAYNMETWAQLILNFVNDIIERPTVLAGNSVGSLACVIAAADLSQTSIQGLVLLNCAGGMNNKAIVDDWRIKLLFPLLWLVDFLLYQRSIASGIFNRVKQRENLKNILLSVYGNKESVDEDLVDIIRTPADAEGALDAFVSIVTGPPGPNPEQLFPNITLHILVLWGDQDPFTPIDGPVWPDLVHEKLLPWLSQLPVVENVVT
ncbi:hypothetical protein K7X08_017897 [Anisodus acutangulus]|uniref:AB hydrolase-1 domain-containing protein n=1 Tax=Anisodus acutangulus TaxID=402998 RepID=A0A9Q1LY85_9SOLA|nr:hypothetical protein K7X08_017897 [Anisodus acutangulus]